MKGKILLALIIISMPIVAFCDTNKVLTFFNTMNWQEILKWIGVVIGSGLSLNTVIGIIFAFIPNKVVFDCCTKFGILITKLFRQKMSEQSVDTIATTLITAIRGLENGLRTANIDLPKDNNK